MTKDELTKILALVLGMNTMKQPTELFCIFPGLRYSWKCIRLQVTMVNVKQETSSIYYIRIYWNKGITTYRVTYFYADPSNPMCTIDQMALRHSLPNQRKAPVPTPSYTYRSKKSLVVYFQPSSSILNKRSKVFELEVHLWRKYSVTL